MNRNAVRAARAAAVGLALCGACTLALANGATTETTSGDHVSSPQRFGWHEDSFAIWQQMRNQGWAGNDEGALRARYSVKYTFCGPRYDRSIPHSVASDPAHKGPTWCPTSPAWNRLELFAAFTGEFDFYAGTRASGPVINRLSNPGFFVRMPLDPQNGGADAPDRQVQIGLEHRSNGQTTEVRGAREAERAELAYRNLDREYFDTISRGSNFLSIAAWGRFGSGSWRMDRRVKLRLYFSQDAAVTWGPLKGRAYKISDYDRLQFDGGWNTGLGRWEVQWRVGDKLLKTDSWVLGWQADTVGLPLYVRMHIGPMNTLSNHTQRQPSIGIGLRFMNL